MYHVVTLELPRLLSHSGVEVMKLCPIMKKCYKMLQQMLEVLSVILRVTA